MKNHYFILLASIWLGVVGVGTAALLMYENTQGLAASVPSDWPSKSKIPRASGRPTLVMFAHPRCPCTRASIRELADMMPQFQNQIEAFVIFLRPNGVLDSWICTDLWRSAESIQGVNVRADVEGREAGYFGLSTSGHVVLYGADGKLLFSGGITASRGHVGQNPACTGLLKLLDHETASILVTPVFGCSLLNPKQECPIMATKSTH